MEKQEPEFKTLNYNEYIRMKNRQDQVLTLGS